MRLRQVALVAKDLDSVSERLGRLLGIDYGYRDPGIIGFGLDNWVAPIGDTYLEVVSPVRENTTAGRFLERRGGDGGYMVILQVPSLGDARAKIESAGARIVWHARGEGENGERTEGLHVHPRDCGGAILSVDESTPTGAWVWAGPEWRQHRSSFLSQISGVEIQAADPRGMAERWSELLGPEAAPGRAPDGRDAWLLDLDAAAPGQGGSGPKRGVIRFVAADDGRGDGVSALDVEVESVETLQSAMDRSSASLTRDRAGWSHVDEAGVRVYFHAA